MTHKTKAYPAKFSMLDEKEGRVEALVSIFGNVDLIGDRVVSGAFSKSIQKWKSSGDPIPVVFSHDWGDPWKHIGVVDDINETQEGLRAVYSLDIDDNPLAKQIFRLMKRRSLKEHSFSYKTNREKRAEDGANELLDMDIIEIGPTLKGVNPETELLAVKSLVEAQEKDSKTPPWHVEEDNSECDGFAVVVDETSKVVGCHSTREAAERQMAALYANVEDADKSNNNIEIYFHGDVKSPQALATMISRMVDEARLKDRPSGTLITNFTGKTGRTISKKTEDKVRQIRQLADEVLSSVAEQPEEEKSTEPEEEQLEVKGEDRENGKPSDDILLRLKAQIIQFENEEV